MKKEDGFKIGFILRPHGLKGEVSASLDETSPESLSEEKAVFLEINNTLVPYFMETISVRGAKAFIKFEEVNTIEAAGKISKCPLYLSKEKRLPSGRNSFHLDEIMNFQVVTVDGTALGEILDVLSAGPNKLLALDHDGKEVLIPVNGPFIKSVNKSKKKITVELPEGFLDI